MNPLLLRQFSTSPTQVINRQIFFATYITKWEFRKNKEFNHALINARKNVPNSCEIAKMKHFKC